MVDVFSKIERKCFICGKFLYPTGDWVYKIKPDGKYKKNSLVLFLYMLEKWWWRKWTENYKIW